ncbi:MAG: Holliday junction resolvase RuvX [Bacteroidaceae bacterium]|nr:Holliday junction resolvase RuvX [Candidatus Colenecus caballi]MCQ2073338.1 Holliday junction resolvase RuvX [Bacteroidaceae bacterium]
MGRILAIDFGTKRTGIAVTDVLRIVPGGLTTVATHELMTFLAGYFSREPVDIVVIGLPTNMNGQESASMKQIRPFVEKFRKAYPDKQVVMFDERFTSVLAQRAILDSGIGKMARRNKALVDEVSATIILQSYMDSIQYKI